MRSHVGRAEPRPRRLTLAYASGGFGLAMVAQAAFLVPLRARELGASFDAIGLIVGAGALAALFASVPSGALLDRLGPRRTFVLAAGVTGLLSLLFPLVTNYWWFLVLQPALGLTRNLGWMASMNYIASMGSDRQRATLTGRFSFISNVGQVIGPLAVGAAAQLVGYRWALLVPALYALFFACLGLFLPETSDGLPDQAQGFGLHSARALLALGGIRVALMLTFATLWINTVFTTFLPVYLTGSGLDPGVVGAVVAALGCVAAVVAPTAGFWTKYRSPTTLAILSLACGALGLLLAAHATTLPWVFLVPVLIGIGSGMSMPLLLTVITTDAPARQRGVALGLRSIATQGAMTTAPFVVGPVIAVLGMTLGLAAAGAATVGMLAGARLLSVTRT